MVQCFRLFSNTEKVEWPPRVSSDPSAKTIHSPGLENRAAELGELVQPVRQGCEAEAEHSLGAPGVQIFNQDIDERTASSPASLESRIQGLGDVQVTEFGVGEAATLGY